VPLTHSTDCSTITTNQGWYSRPINGCSNSGLVSTPAEEINKNLEIKGLTFEAITEMQNGKHNAAEFLS
jgi:hypothetical protein